MKLQVTGIIERIGDIIPIPSKDGQRTFNKRDLFLDLTTYDRYTGEPRANHVAMEFSGNRCTALDGFNVGDRITVSFVLSGSNYTSSTGEQKNFTRIVGYEVAKFGTENTQDISAPEAVSSESAQQPAIPKSTNAGTTEKVELPF